MMTKENRGWPIYIFNGRLRTSTVALILAFLLVWWIYEANQPEPKPAQEAPSTQVVPPGFVPDPNYTWVPRTDVQPRQTTTPTTTPTTTTTTPTTTTTTPTETTSPKSPTDTTTSDSPTTSPTTTTPAPAGAPPESPSPAAPGPGPSPTPSR